MIRNLEQYIHCALLLSTTNRKNPENIAIETNKINLAQREPMKKESETAIETCLQQLNNF